MIVKILYLIEWLEDKVNTTSTWDNKVGYRKLNAKEQSLFKKN